MRTTVLLIFLLMTPAFCRAEQPKKDQPAPAKSTESQVVDAAIIVIETYGQVPINEGFIRGILDSRRVLSKAVEDFSEADLRRLQLESFSRGALDNRRAFSDVVKGASGILKSPEFLRRQFSRNPIVLTDVQSDDREILVGLLWSWRGPDSLAAAAKELRHVLSDIASINRRSVYDQYRELQRSVTQLAQRYVDARTKQDQLIKEVGGDDSSAQRLATAGKLRDERRQLLLEMGGLAMRQEALERLIAEAGSEAKAAVQQNHLGEILEKAANKRKERFKMLSRMHQKSATISMDQVLQAQLASDDAESELARVRQEIASEASSRVTALRQQYAETQVAQSEARGRMATVDKLIKEVHARSHVARQLDLLNVEAELTLRSWQEAVEKQKKMRFQLDMKYIPQVTLIPY